MKPIQRFLAWLAVATSSAAFVACGGDDPAPATTPPNVTGQVVTADTDAPLEGAVVTAGDRSTRTGADGRFALSGVAPADRVVVRVEAAGHGPNTAAVALAPQATADVRVRLIRLAPAQTFAAAEAATLSNAGSSARVELPAAALVDAATGAAATGTVSASLTNVDPATDPERMPGNYRTMAGTTERTIESFGAVKVDLRDAAGRRLNLAPGKTATVRIPLSTRSPNPPATLPLWWFDEATGRWVEEGQAQLRTGDGAPYYEGTVSHFSYWNADMVAETVVLEGCVVDGNGKPVAGVQVNSSGVDYSGRNSTVTDAQGNFRIEVRKNATTGVWGATDDRITAVNEVTMGEYDGAMKGGCMVLEAATSPVPGRLAPRVMQPLRNQSVVSGDLAMFTAVVEGTHPMTYEWSRNGTPVAGQNGSTLFVFPTSSADNGAVYTVKVTNAAGTTTSTGATLTVTTTATAPVIWMHPRPATVTAGQTVAFVTAVDGAGPLAYQWLRNGQPIAGATGPELRFQTTDADNGATYTVRVSNAAGTDTSEGAQLKVVPVDAPPVIAIAPRGATVAVGATVTFDVHATGSGTLRYQWQRNGVDIPGATGDSYTLANVTVADHLASFRVVVSNASGSTPSTAAVLTVNQGTADQTERVRRLFWHWTSGLTAAGAPLLVADDDFKVLANAAVCEAGGAVAATLDGGGVTAGQALPLGTHTLATRYTACDTGAETTYDGLASLVYDFPTADHRKGTVQATVTDLVHRSTDLTDVLRDQKVNGQARIELDGSLVGTTETLRMRFIPAAGFTVADVGDGIASTAVSGSVLSHTVLVGEMPQTMRQEFAAYTFTRGGVTYVFDGFVQIEFKDQALVATGTVTIRANGVEVARVSGSETDLYGVEVLNGGLPASAGLLAAPGAQRATGVRRIGLRR